MSEETFEAPQTEEQVEGYVKELLRWGRQDSARWDHVLASLKELLEGPFKVRARELVEVNGRKERLDFQWKIDSVLEETAPPPPPAPPAPEPEAEPEPEPEPANHAVSAADLIPIYDDPRGILIHEHKTDKRWFLTQFNPQTGEPQTQVVNEFEKTQIRAQLMGSPHWITQPS